MEPDKKPDDSSKMEKELTALIDGLSLEEDDKIHKQFLKSRWLDQLLWMDKASRKNQNYYYIFRLSCIVGGVLIPALVSIHAEGTMGRFFRYLTVMFSLIVAVSAAVEEFFHFGERWRHYRRMAEILKGEGWSFFQRSGNYRKYDSHAHAYPEFACIKFLKPHIDWPSQQTVGIHINVSHTAATPPGMTVTVKGRLEKVDGRKLSFAIEAFDDQEPISSGTHDRFIIDAEKFNAAVAKKMTKIGR